MHHLFGSLACAVLVSGQYVPGAVNVHVMPHSHDDVGWLKTPEEYLFGTNIVGILPSLYFAQGAVLNTITSVVLSLQANPNRTFLQVEQWFFQHWYYQQDAYMRQVVQQVVASGQLEFGNGGMSMHDEACPTLADMLHNTEAGHRFIRQEFGEAAIPKTTIQWDPFGHSAAQAALFSTPSAGVTSVFYARIDYEEGAVRHANKTMDYAWLPSPSLGLQAISLGVWTDGYSNPDGLCFDTSILCLFTNPIVVDPLPDAEESNVLSYVDLAVQQAVSDARSYPASQADGIIHVPWTMGDDFQWAAAHANYASLDKLVQYVNMNTSQHGVHLLYSTPSRYAQARLAAAASTGGLQVKTDDVFPYADGPHSVWAGYFSSRPGLKQYVRVCSAHLQADRQIALWAGAGSEGAGPTSTLWLLETSIGVTQHHDSITGTAKQAVTYDYARRLAAGRVAADAGVSRWLNNLTTPAGMQPTPLAYSFCDLANATVCPAIESASVSAATVALVVYNSMAQARPNAPLYIPVGIIPANSDTAANGTQSWRVLAADGVTPITAQLLPLSDADIYLRELYYLSPAGPAGNPTGAMMWLAFQVPSLPAAGYTTVYLQPVSSRDEAPATHMSQIETALGTAPGPTMSNGNVTLSFDGTTGLLSTFSSTTLNGGQPVPVSQSVLYYPSSKGDSQDGQAGGAYIFRPWDNETALPVWNTSSPGPFVNLTIINGPVVCEARQTFAPWVEQKVRLWHGVADSFETSWTIGPVPVADSVGKDVVTRYDLAGGFNNEGRWRTDANTWEMQPRVRNSRQSYVLNVTEPVAQNYFPINIATDMRDTATGLTFLLVTDRSTGGGSLADGQIEACLHRRLVADDSRGVMEALNEPGVNGLGLVVRGSHTVVITLPGAAPQAQKQATQASLHPLLWSAAALPQGVSAATWATGHVPSFTGLTSPLPPAVELITLHAWNASTVLIRLRHLYEANEDPTYSTPVTVNLGQILAGYTVTAVVEQILTGGKPLASVDQTTYVLQNRGSVTLPVLPPAPQAPNFSVTIAPMEVRTYLLTVTR